MTNPSVICFFLAFAIMAIGVGLYVYEHRHRIHDWFEGWVCYMICKDLHKRDIAIEPATNWVHRRAVEYAIKHNKKAIFVTEG